MLMLCSERVPAEYTTIPVEKWKMTVEMIALSTTICHDVLAFLSEAPI